MGQRTRICLIDDDPYVREALAMALADHGYDVIAAPGGFAGLDVLRRDTVSAVITDMNMPGHSGADLIASIRAEDATLPIVAISGSDEIAGRNLLDLAREAGADACLLKPFRAREIAATLDRVIAARA